MKKSNEMYNVHPQTSKNETNSFNKKLLLEKHNFIPQYNLFKSPYGNERNPFKYYTDTAKNSNTSSMTK